MILCIVISVISLLPKVQERMPYSGLLQSSFLTLYVMFLSWSALMNNPGRSKFDNRKSHRCLQTKSATRR